MRPGAEGFTLTEVAVALVLLGVGTLGVLELARAGGVVGWKAAETEGVLWAAGALADSLGTAGGGTGTLETPGGHTLVWAVGASGGWVEVVPPGADTAWLRLPVVPFPGPVPRGADGGVGP